MKIEKEIKQIKVSEFSVERWIIEENLTFINEKIGGLKEILISYLPKKEKEINNISIVEIMKVILDNKDILNIYINTKG